MLSEKSKKYIIADLLNGYSVNVSDSQLGNVLSFLKTEESIKYKLILTNMGKDIWKIRLSSQLNTNLKGE